MTKYEFHSLSEIFPLMEGSAFEKFVADIKANGLRDPIVLLDGKILDGRNRYRGCDAAGIEPRFKDWDGQGSPRDFVISENLHRRHLNETQRAMVGAKIANINHGGDRKSDQDQNSDLDPKSSVEDAAKLLNVSHDTVSKARAVIEKGAPELVAAVESGKMRLNTAKRICDLPKDKQKEVLAEGQPAIERVRQAEHREKSRARNQKVGNKKRKTTLALRGEIGKQIDEIHKLVFKPWLQISYLNLQKMVEELRESFAKSFPNQ